MALIGYARTSTLEQVAGFEAQIAALIAAGCASDDIFSERVSSVDIAARRQLAAVLRYVRKGDTLVITKIDRLARNVAHLFEIVEQLTAKGAALRILDLNIDTGGAAGKLILTMMGGFAAFERETMLERQRVGIAKAKAEGKFKGRVPTARAKSADVLKLHSQGVGAVEIAERLGISRVSVWRIVKAAA